MSAEPLVPVQRRRRRRRRSIVRPGLAPRLRRDRRPLDACDRRRSAGTAASRVATSSNGTPIATTRRGSSARSSRSPAPGRRRRSDRRLSCSGSRARTTSRRSFDRRSDATATIVARGRRRRPLPESSSRRPRQHLHRRGSTRATWSTADDVGRIAWDRSAAAGSRLRRRARRPGSRWPRPAARRRGSRPAQPRVDASRPAMAVFMDL